MERIYSKENYIAGRSHLQVLLVRKAGPEKGADDTFVYFAPLINISMVISALKIPKIDR